MHRLMRAFVLPGVFGFSMVGAGCASPERCGGLGDVGAGVHRCGISEVGPTRTYELYVPEERTEPLGLVVSLHGHGQDGSAFHSYTRMRAFAEQRGFIAVAPDGFLKNWDTDDVQNALEVENQRSWNSGACCGDAKAEGVDDVAVLRSIVDEVKVALPIDDAHVFVLGHGAGGRMAHAFACAASDVVAAAASVAAPFSALDPETLEPVERCAPERPVAMMDFRGTADDCAPFDGDDETLSAADSLAAWGAADGCGALDVSREIGATTCSSFADCEGGVDVTQCVTEGAGHGWPGGPAPQYTGSCGGAPSADLDGTDEILSFFWRNAR